MARKRGVSGGKGGGPGEREALLARYRTILVDKLTAEDLRELQDSLRKEFDERGNLNLEYREKFEYKLRRFLHEEILTREIVGIEALVRSLRPEDLKR